MCALGSPLPRRSLPVVLATSLGMLWAGNAVNAQSGAAASTRILEREVDVGLGLLDESSFRYGKYSGLADAGLEPLLDFRLVSQPQWDSGEVDWWRATGLALGQSARQLTVEVGQHGRQRLELGLRQIPRNSSDSARTPFGGVGSGFLGLPPGWQAAADTTAGLAPLGPSLEDVSIRERRRRLTLDYRRELAGPWQVAASYRHDAKAGRRVLGGTIGSTGGNARAALLPVALDLETDVIDLSAVRMDARYSVGLGYTGSFFRNNLPSVSWQNPFGAHPGWAPGVGFPDGLGRVAREPDNTFHQLSATAAYALTDTTSATFSFSHGRMLQDEPFLPYTVNPRLSVPQPLPRSSLDGRLDVTRLNLTLSARPQPRLQLAARYAYDDRDDKTPREAYRLVRGDAENQLPADLARINRPYSLREHRLGVDASYRIARGLRLQAGYSYTDTSRDFQEVRDADEHTYRAGIRVSTLPPLALTFDYLRARRSVGAYVGNRPFLETRVPGAVDEDQFENHPLLRKYHLADRDRDGRGGRADVSVGSNGSLGVSAAWHRDDYRNSLFGLTRSTMRSYTLDGGWAPAEDVQLTAFYTRDAYASDQAGRSFTAAPEQALDPDRNWWVDSRDRFSTAGLSVNVERLERHWPALQRAAGTAAVAGGLDVVYATSRGRIGVTSGPAVATAPLPDLRTRLQLYRLHGSYPLPNDARLRVALEHERYRTRDFAFDGVEPGVIPNVLDLGHDSPSYSVNWLVLSYLMRF